MALVKFGGGVIQMSGSIAGNTYARNRFGNYVRSRTKPTNPKSAQQVAIRASIASLADRWSQVLDDAKRQSWNLYGASVNMKNRLGETVNLTGFNHFIRSNAIKCVYKKTLSDDGPGIFELPGQDPEMAVTATEDPQQISVAYDKDRAWNDETGGFLWVYQGVPQNAQRNFFAGPWRLLGSVIGETGVPVASPLVATPQFPIAEGQRLWVYARIQRADGRLSEIFRADCFVTENGA
ncbi:unnamed protein product, partial [marine sediment metagenome]